MVKPLKKLFSLPLDAWKKINELVDAVNDLEARIDGGRYIDGKSFKVVEPEKVDSLDNENKSKSGRGRKKNA